MRRVIVVLTLLARSAAAQPSGSDAAAQSHFRVGATDYDAGRYESALHEFDEAYRLSQRPALLYNIGRCYEQLGRHAEAIEAYERYLVEAPDATERVEAKARIDRLRSEASKVQPTRTLALSTPSPSAAPPPEKRPVYRRGWFWGVMVGAAAVVAGGVAVGVVFGRPRDTRMLAPVQLQ